MSYYNKKRHEVLKYVAVIPKKVLELGCGTGAFGKLLKEKYACEITGIELKAEAASIANNVLDYVYSERIETLVRAGILHKEFDLVILNDVIEHIEDPSEFLNCIKKVLNNNGQIIASIPNFIYIDNIVKIIIRKDFEYQDSGILDKTHLRFFTKKSIERLFCSEGFKIELLEPLNYNSTLKWKILKMITAGWIDEFSVYQYIVRASFDSAEP